MSAPSVSGANVSFEGTTDDEFDTTLTVTDPTADRTITLPDSTGTVALTSDISAPGPSRGFGYIFTRTDANTLTLTPDGIDGKAHVPVSNGSDMVSVAIDSAINLDMANTGNAGGVQVAEAINTGYNIYLITEDGGANPKMWAVPYGTAISFPGAYTHASRIFWFVRNDASGDIVDFIDRNGTNFYQTLFLTIDAEKNTSAPSGATGRIDLTGYVPDNSDALLYQRCWNDAADQFVSIFSITTVYIESHRCGTGYGSVAKEWTNYYPVMDVQNSLWYQWNGTPTAGLYNTIIGWRFP